MALSPVLLRSAFHGVRLSFPARSLFINASSLVLVEEPEVEVNRLKDTYLDLIVPFFMEKFNYTKAHQVPKVEKIVVNCGIGDAAQNAKGLEVAMHDLEVITGQRPIKMRGQMPIRTRAKKPIATSKFREDQPPGIFCTLRGNVMYSFLERLINLGLPRMQDFHGVSSNSFDGNGNYRIRFREQSVFPELSIDDLGKPRRMNICITTTAKTDKDAHRLLAFMGMPFREGDGLATTTVRKMKLKSHHFNS